MSNLALNALASRVPALLLPIAKLRFDYLIAFNRRIGLRLHTVAMDTGSVTLRLPFSRGNCNAAGTVHGGAILALAESVHGFALAFGLREQPGVRIFTKEAQLRFIKKATSDLLVSCTIGGETRARVAAQLEANAATELRLTSLVTDRSSSPIAELAASYHLSRRR